MKQWHPIFAQLLRPAMEAYYDVQTTLPVGDAPREAEHLIFQLVRRERPVREPDASCFHPIDGITGEHQLHRPPQTEEHRVVLPVGR